MSRAVVAAVILAWAAPAAAQPADVPALIALVDKQPAGMDRAAWKEQRREAVRKLGAARDKRAVPTLIAVARSETFDKVGELAIEALGIIGDAASVPLLQEIVADANRDAAQRELARKALARMKAPIAAPVVAPPPVDEPEEAPPVVDTPPADTSTPIDAAVVPLLGGDDTAAGDPVPGGPDLPEDTLGAYERLTFALGGVAVSWDSLRDRAAADADVAGSYARRLDREKLAWGADATARVVAGLLNPDGRAGSRAALLALDAGADVRSYLGPGGTHGLFAFGEARLGLQGTYVAVRPDDANQEDVAVKRLDGDVAVALGVGWGRVLDVGAALRIARLAAVLEAARALGRPIDEATARRLQLAWWGLRGRRSDHAVLAATVDVLRSAGVLLGDPDVGLTYELLSVLRDAQLDRRARGHEVSLGFGESYLFTDEIDNSPLREDGRVEQLLLRGRYARPLGLTQAIDAAVFARRRVLAADDAPSPWAVGVGASWRRARYGEHGDPLGELDAAARLSASSDDLDLTDASARLEVTAGYTLAPNVASSLRLGGEVALDAGEIFFGATLGGTYAFADGAYAAP